MSISESLSDPEVGEKENVDPFMVTPMDGPPLEFPTRRIFDWEDDWNNFSIPERQRAARNMHDSLFSTLAQIQSRDSGVQQRFRHLMSARKTGDEVIVDWDGKDDPYKPINWPFKKKCLTTALYGFTTFGITLASSIYSAGSNEIAAEFDVSPVVATLGTSLMLFGFGLGPLLWAPLSECYGRKTAVLLPYLVATCFSFATGAAKDIQTVMISRFFTGFFGSAPITNAGGVLGDIWDPKQRGVALVFYAFSVLGGPTIGPVVGRALCDSDRLVGWRWTQYLSGLIMLYMLITDYLCLDESFGPVLLVYKARRLRQETGNWAFHARHEEWDVSVRELARKYLIRPIRLVFTPIAFLIDLYSAFVYGILYASLGSFPVEFQGVRGWSPVVASLPFMALLLGILLGGVANIYNQKYYVRKLEATNMRPVPEARLPPMMAGSIVFAAGLFIFAWTSSPSVHWLPSVVGACMIGFGFFTIFQPSLNYMIDTFSRYSASAVASQTFLRSMFAGGFPLFITPLCLAIGVKWCVTIFACVATVLIPVPYLFFYYGKKIRARGEWSRESL